MYAAGFASCLLYSTHLLRANARHKAPSNILLDRTLGGACSLLEVGMGVPCGAPRLASSPRAARATGRPRVVRASQQTGLPCPSTATVRLRAPQRSSLSCRPGAPARARAPPLPRTTPRGGWRGPSEPNWKCNPVVARHGPGQDPGLTTVRRAPSAALLVARASTGTATGGPLKADEHAGAAWLSSTGHPSWTTIHACTVARLQVLWGHHGPRGFRWALQGGV